MKTNTGISIHALLAESDYDTSSLMQCQVKFLSTLSLRRATNKISTVSITRKDFYPRSPCGERHVAKRTTDTRPPFLSTLSLRRATISCAWSASKLGDFYPRSPCGERLCLSIFALWMVHFYPRSPCGERPTNHGQATSTQPISIHALLAESDLSQTIPASSMINFYPRSPCGERPSKESKRPE